MMLQFPLPPLRRLDRQVRVPAIGQHLALVRHIGYDEVRDFFGLRHDVREDFIQVLRLGVLQHIKAHD